MPYAVRTVSRSSGKLAKEIQLAAWSKTYFGKMHMHVATKCENSSIKAQVFETYSKTGNKKDSNTSPKETRISLATDMPKDLGSSKCHTMKIKEKKRKEV